MTTLTANYGFTKPDVLGSNGQWGTYLNGDLDSIDATVKTVSNNPGSGPSSTTPLMDGSATAGTGTTWARADHVHPIDTSRYAASNPSGYQTAAQVTAAVPAASSTTPLMDGYLFDPTPPATGRRAPFRKRRWTDRLWLRVGIA